MSARDVIVNAMCAAWNIADAERDTDAIISALRAAGYMIVPREPTDARLRAASMRQQPSLGHVYPSVYRAMTAEGELK